MKCQYLITKISIDEIANLGYTDYVVCLVPPNSDGCPKKKQPCQINARCWRMGS